MFRQPDGAGGPAAQVATGAGEQQLPLRFRQASVAAFSAAIAALEFAVGSLDSAAPPHADLVDGCFAKIASRLNQHVQFAHLNGASRNPFSGREALGLQRADRAIRLGPCEVVLRSGATRLEDARTFGGFLAGRAEGRTVGNVHAEGVGAEARAAVGRCADRPAQLGSKKGSVPGFWYFGPRMSWPGRAGPHWVTPDILHSAVAFLYSRMKGCERGFVRSSVRPSRRLTSPSCRATLRK